MRRGATGALYANQFPISVYSSYAMFLIRRQRHERMRTASSPYAMSSVADAVCKHLCGNVSSPYAISLVHIQCLHVLCNVFSSDEMSPVHMQCLQVCGNVFSSDAMSSGYLHQFRPNAMSSGQMHCLQLLFNVSSSDSTYSSVSYHVPNTCKLLKFKFITLQLNT